MSESHGLDAFREYEARLIEDAKERLTRNEDGSFDKEKLILEVAKIAPFEISQARYRNAKGIVNRAERPGSTKPDGQLLLPGFKEPYDYEPNRLVSDDRGNVIENSRAPEYFKAAETERARLNVDRVVAIYNIKLAETAIFRRWALRERLAGRPTLDLTWDTCIRENNLRPPRRRRAG